MNCCIILLLLLFCNQNGLSGQNDNGCGCKEERSNESCRARESREARESERESCSCGDSRFEPRFESRPFGGSTCGCEED